MERSKKFGLTKYVLLVNGLAKPIAICTIIILGTGQIGRKSDRNKIGSTENRIDIIGSADGRIDRKSDRQKK